MYWITVALIDERGKLRKLGNNGGEGWVIPGLSDIFPKGGGGKLLLEDEGRSANHHAHNPQEGGGVVKRQGGEDAVIGPQLTRVEEAKTVGDDLLVGDDGSLREPGGSRGVDVGAPVTQLQSLDVIEGWRSRGLPADGLVDCLSDLRLTRTVGEEPEIQSS